MSHTIDRLFTTNKDIHGNTLHKKSFISITAEEHPDAMARMKDVEEYC